MVLLAGSKKLQNLIAFATGRTVARRKSESLSSSSAMGESPVVPGSRCKNRVIIRPAVAPPTQDLDNIVFELYKVNPLQQKYIYKKS